MTPTPSPCTTPELCSLLNEAKHKGSTPSPQPTDDAIPFGDWLSINNAKVRNATLDEERKRISNEIARILREHPARTVNRFFLQELEQSLRGKP